MISRVEINGYKCLLDVIHSCGRLNVLVGANASGKSSFIQALLLLRQSKVDGEIRRLVLSGSLVEAGTAKDILHPSSNHSVSIRIEDGSEISSYHFYHDRSSESGVSSRALNATKGYPANGKIFDSSDSFAYLNAERVGPRVSYSLPDDADHSPGWLGKHGEFTAGYLARCMSGLIVPDWDSVFTGLSTAIREIDGYDFEQDLYDTGGRIDLVAKIVLGWVLPGASFDVSLSEELDSASTFFLRDPLGSRVKVRSTHVGFGLTYSLPIIVSALSLSQESLFFVENPEAHLHPFSQSRLGVFMAVMADLGRQAFVETHSDHFVNGVRLAVKHGLINYGDVSFAYFEPPYLGETASVLSIEIDKNGFLSDWPKGFFDQIESDLSRL